MTEPEDRVDGEDRAERALRDALGDRADAFEPRELTVPRRVRRDRGWIPAAAAVVILVGGVTAIGVTAGGGGSSSSDSATSASIAGGDADAPQQGIAGSKGANPGVAPEDDTGGGDQVMRWVSRYDVEVQVPSTWGYAAPPLRPDCIRRPGDTWDDAPRAPYVATDVTGRAVPAIGCEPTSKAPSEFGDLPFELWQPSLSFSSRSAFAKSYGPGPIPDGTWTYRGWRLTRWTVPNSSVQLTLLTRPGQDTLATQIKKSTRTFTTDANGCPATSPVQATELVKPSAVTSASRLTPSSVSVCQYARGNTAAAGLIGSRRVTGSEMGSLLKGIAEAPSGSGPNATAGCDHAPPADTAIELRYHRGDEEPASAYVYYGSCAGNGIYDADSVKRLTAADCLPLFAEPPVTLQSSDDRLQGVCRR